MRIQLKHFSLAALIVVAAAACSTVTPSGAPSIAQPQSARVRPQVVLSWMEGDSATQPLLYVSDPENSTVDVYANYLSNRIALAGQLTGLSYPYGSCSDRSGNVYITETYGSDVVEYAHAGTVQLRKLGVQGNPIGCSIDPVSGNLAVSIYAGAQGSNTRGGVFIFKKATGKPVLHTDSQLWQIWPPAYDSSGNLFVLGYNPTVELAELPAGGKTFRQISLGKTSIQAPGSVRWSGNDLYAVDQQYKGGNTTAVYRLSISGTRATVLATTILSDTCNGNGADVVQPLIVGTTIFGGNHSCTHQFGYWKYPDGGNPVHTMNGSIAPLGGTGQTISLP